MGRGLRKASGKFIFIPPETLSEAELRRNQTVKRLREIYIELDNTRQEQRDCIDELRNLNRVIKSC